MSKSGVESYKKGAECSGKAKVARADASAKLADDYYNTVTWKGSQFDSEILDNIKQHRVQRLDYSNAWDANSKAILFGECHTDFSAKSEVAKAIPKLRKLGATHLCMEMLEQVDQALIDAYMNGKCPRYKIKNLFASEKWGWNGQAGAEGYMQIVDAAKRAGMKLVALDLTPEQREKQIAARTKITYEPAVQSKLLKTFVKPIARESKPSDTEVREESWTNKIVGIAEVNKSAKFVVYAGSAHNSFWTDGGMSKRLADRLHTRPVTVVFEGGAKKNPFAETNAVINQLCGRGETVTRPFFDKMVEKAHLQQQTFAIKIDMKYPAFIQHNPESGDQDYMRMPGFRDFVRKLRVAL